MSHYTIAVNANERISATPEHRLAWAVLAQAYEDVTAEARTAKARKLHDRACLWALQRDSAWPYAFENLCDAFGLEVERVRALFLKNANIKALSGEAKRKEVRRKMARLTSSGPQGDVTVRLLDKPAQEYTDEELAAVLEKVRGTRGQLTEARKAARPRGSVSAGKPVPAFDPSLVED